MVRSPPYRCRRSPASDGTVVPCQRGQRFHHHVHLRVTPELGVGSYRPLRANRQRTGQADRRPKENRSVVKARHRVGPCRRERAHLGVAAHLGKPALLRGSRPLVRGLTERVGAGQDILRRLPRPRSLPRRSADPPGALGCLGRRDLRPWPDRRSQAGAWASPKDRHRGVSGRIDYCSRPKGLRARPFGRP